MLRYSLLSLAVLGLFGVSAASAADDISGIYLETRTCQVYTGPCFANAETALAGKDAARINSAKIGPSHFICWPLQLPAWLGK